MYAYIYIEILQLNSKALFGTLVSQWYRRNSNTCSRLFSTTNATKVENRAKAPNVKQNYYLKLKTYIFENIEKL